MKTEERTVAINKDFFPTSAGDLLPLIVVYKTEDKLWRGFVDPYGETTEASTKEAAVEKMRVLTAAYKSTVEEYGSPKHLVYAGIGDLADREVFSNIVSQKILMEKLHSEGKVEGKFFYVETYRD